MKPSPEADLATRFTVSMPKALADRIEKYWHEHSLRSHSEAVRVLVEAGLEAEKQGRRRSA